MSWDRCRIPVMRLTSVPHCTDVGLVAVAMDKSACGEPLGWCPDRLLGRQSRGDDYVGLRIWNPVHGDCWGHTLKVWLPAIFQDAQAPGQRGEG